MEIEDKDSAPNGLKISPPKNNISVIDDLSELYDDSLTDVLGQKAFATANGFALSNRPQTVQPVPAVYELKEKLKGEASAQGTSMLNDCEEIE